MNSLLSSSDYEGVLKFYTLINADYEHFISNVLLFLSEIFGYHLSTYAIFNKNYNGDIFVEEIYSESFHEESLRNYRNLHYKSDLFFLRASYKTTTTSMKYLYTIDDIATYDEFFETVYGCSLRSQNIGHQVIMRGALNKPVPFHILSIFKTSSEGGFSAHEIELLNSIGKMFSKSVNLYKEYIHNKNFHHYLNFFCDSQNMGLAIVDEHLHVLYFNELFLKNNCEAFATSDINSTVAAVIENMKKNSVTQPDKLTDFYCFSVANCQIRVEPFRHYNGETLRRLLFITTTIADASPPTKKQTNKSLEQYSFTSRELEIAELLLAGYDNNKIADELFISAHTVKFHIRNILGKLGVTSRTAAIAKILN